MTANRTFEVEDLYHLRYSNGGAVVATKIWTEWIDRAIRNEQATADHSGPGDHQITSVCVQYACAEVMRDWSSLLQ